MVNIKLLIAPLQSQERTSESNTGASLAATLHNLDHETKAKQKSPKPQSLILYFTLVSSQSNTAWLNSCSPVNVPHQ